mgnify:CR=1 FL=1
MRKLAIYTMLVLAMLLGVASRAVAQKFIVGADFATLFDNTEYAAMLYSPRSETLFSSRLTPKLGFGWNERHSVILGVDLVQDFGHDSRFVSDVNVQMYYNFDAPRVKVFAGIFPREAMRGLRSSIFFDRGYRYYNNRIQGVVARYEDGVDSYVEFAMDYTGMRSEETREAFAIMSSARKSIYGRNGAGDMHLGYDFLMGHYAKDYNPATEDGVVDNIMLTPLIGYSHAFATGESRPSVNLCAEAKYILSLQRDRAKENVWCAPQGAEIMVEAEWYGAVVRNRLYVGGNLLSYFGRYGADLYHGSPFYGTEKGVFNAVELGYKRLFCEGILAVEAGVSIDYDGTGWGTRQFISLGVNFNHGFDIKK